MCSELGGVSALAPSAGVSNEQPPTQAPLSTFGQVVDPGGQWRCQSRGKSGSSSQPGFPWASVWNPPQAMPPTVVSPEAAAPRRKDPWPIVPVPASARRDVSFTVNNPSPSLSTSKFSSTVPSSAVPGIPSGPATKVCEAPTGTSRSAVREKQTGPRPIGNSFDLTFRQRSTRAGFVATTVCIVLLARNSNPAWLGLRLPSVTV